MKLTRAMRLRLRSLRRHRLDRDLSDEYAFHLETSTEAYVAEGMDPVAARERALQELGNRAALKESSRELFTFLRIETWLHDIRLGFRVLRRNIGYSTASIAILALGIGASVAIFSVVYGVLLRPLPYSGGEDLVVLHQEAPRAGLDDVPFSAQEIFDYRDMSQTLDAVVEHHSMSFLLLTGEEAQRVDTAVVSANFFDVLGVRPLLGRTFLPSDDAPGSEAVIVLSYEYWQNRQGGNPDIVGAVFEMNDRPHRVIGVLPPIPQYPVENEVYMPTSHCPTRSSPEFIANRQARMMTAFGRLSTGATYEEAQAELSTIAARLEDTYPEAYPDGFGYGLRLTSLKEDLTRRAETTFLLLLGGAGFVLLIACANVANLFLARLMKLNREISLRLALGASRARLVRQLLTENTLLSVSGGAVGVAIAWAMQRLLADFAARFTTRAAEIQIDLPVLLFALFLSLAAGFLLALGPALVPGRQLAEAVKHQGSRLTLSRGGRRVRGGLVVLQVMVSFVLLTGAGLMIRSFIRLQQVDPGFDTDRILSMRLSPNHFRIPDMSQMMAQIDRLGGEILREVSAIPGVRSVALTNGFPFRPEGIANGPASIGIEIEGRAQKGLERTADADIVSLDYFETIGQAVLAGRTFTSADDGDAPIVAVINETMARNWFEGESPLGRTIHAPGSGLTAEIVGVVSDVRDYGLDRPSVDKFYVFMDQFEFGQNLLVRTSVPPMGVFPAIRQALLDLDSELAVDRVATVDSLRQESVASPRLMTTFLGVFALLALGISAGGIAAMSALAVSQRTREFGVRMALGATRRSVFRMVLGEGLKLGLVGILLGAIGAAAVLRLLASFLYDTEPIDPLTLGAVALVFLLAAAMACLVPARRATRVDPMVALRNE